MYMKINFEDFTREIKAIRKEHFSYEGLRALYDYFTELEDEIGEELELDPIQVIINWHEFERVEDALSDYGVDSIEELEELTTVLYTKKNTILVRDF